MRGAFDIIDERLWVGPAPFTPGDYRKLVDLGITHILCLQPINESESMGLSDHEIRDSAKQAGLSFTRVPIKNFDRFSMLEEVPKATIKVLELLSRGESVYIHCGAGINRAPTVAAAVIAVRHSISVKAACDWISRLHPSAPDCGAVQQYIEAPESSIDSTS